MESSPRIVAFFIAGIICLSVTSLAADTYRWKDKDGKVHYGSTVPAEYAEQPYDILNSAGMVIEHVEDTSTPIEERVEVEIKTRKPLISEEERKRQSDRLLVIQYRSEEEIGKALELEIAQLGYDSRIINQSYESTSTAIRNQVRQAANQQRANLEISADQQKGIKKLYSRLARDQRKRDRMTSRENQIRAHFQADLERYQFLTRGTEPVEEEQADQG